MAQLQKPLAAPSQRTGSVHKRLWGTRFHMGLIPKALTYLLLTIIAAIFVLPFLWMVSTALKPDALVVHTPPLWFPRPFLWRNFYEAVTIRGYPVYLYVWNTVYYSCMGVLGTLVSSSLAAFGFARLEFRGRNTLFIILMSTLMMPFAVTMVPTFIMFQKVGWIDSFKPLLLPAWLSAFGGAYNIFLLRQFFLGIPREYDEAARLDGASSLRIYWNVILPQARPVLGAVAVFAFVYYWNDFLWPLIVLQSQDHFTLSLFLAAFRGYMRQTRWSLLMAASTLLMLPCLVLFFMAQRAFIEGIAITGMKA